MQRALFTSYAATASASAFVVDNVRNSFGAKAELREFWEELATSSFLCKPFWTMYVEKILA
jgi:hypothetical protein